MYFSYQNGIILNTQFETPLASTLCHVCKTDYWNVPFWFRHASSDLLDDGGQFLYHTEEVPFNSDFMKKEILNFTKFFFFFFFGNYWTNRLNGESHSNVSWIRLMALLMLNGSQISGMYPTRYSLIHCWILNSDLGIIFINAMKP